MKRLQFWNKHFSRLSEKSTRKSIIENSTEAESSPALPSDRGKPFKPFRDDKEEFLGESPLKRVKGNENLTIKGKEKIWGGGVCPPGEKV